LSNWALMASQILSRMTSLSGWQPALLNLFARSSACFDQFRFGTGVRLLQNVTLQRDLFNAVARHVLANQALPRVSSRPKVSAPVASNHIAMPPCPYFCNLFTAVLVFVFLLISCGCLSIFSESYVCIFPLTSQSWAILVSDFSLFIEMILFCLS